MTHDQWNTLVSVVNGESLDAPPVGFIIDSPWLPNWAGMSILDYLTGTIVVEHMRASIDSRRLFLPLLGNTYLQ